uniref:Uncharacterized protein n=1 Tax=Nelumbo nucifera TaxID=4432 RepID=A0A822ZNT9_NELNU|nr:TPA_asm: hypothetical protein HUJ06_017591 [Nelumbo nucifera]
MEGDRGAPRSCYELEVPFSTTPQPIQEMGGFMQFEESQGLSFLVPSQSSQLSLPLNHNNNGSSNSVGLNGNEVATRPLWNDTQVVELFDNEFCERRINELKYNNKRWKNIFI